MNRYKQALLELFLLATVTWAVAMAIDPVPDNLNGGLYGGKWFLYTYAMNAVLLVVVPFSVLLAWAASSRSSSRPFGACFPSTACCTPAEGAAP